MKYLKEFNSFINEELREEEMDKLLDKISKSGIDSLSDKERKELEEFDGDYDTSPLDKVEFDEEGDLRINGKRANPYNIPSEFYDEDRNPHEMNDSLEEYITNYLNNNYELRNMPGAFNKQVFDISTDNFLTLPELIDRVLYDLNISVGSKGTPSYNTLIKLIRTWIKEYH